MKANSLPIQWSSQAFTASILLGLTLTQAGCFARRTVVIHEPPRPGYVVAVPAAAPAPAPVVVAPPAGGQQTPTIEVQQAPPAPMVETIPPTPGPGYVWTSGYWVWSGQWVWYPGRWLLPPQPRATWVTGRWEYHRGRVWHYYPGHWQ